MRDPAAPASISPKVWMAVVGAVGTLFATAAACVTLLLGLIALGAVLVNYGGWKSGVDQHIAAQDAHIVAMETASKEQTAALASSADKQVQGVLSAAKEMVAGLERSTDKRLTDIENDRRAKIEEYQHNRAADEAKSAKVDTLLTNQQKQIDFLVGLSGERRPAH